MGADMEETEERWARQKREQTEFLKEIGQEYPPCGFSVGDGWKEPVYDALRQIAAVGIPWELAQVKQKFCQLRIYVDFPGSGKVVPIDFIGSGQRMDVGMPNEDGTVSIWEEGHPDHSKYLRINEIIAECCRICDTRCEDCGAQTDGGAASGWKGCQACKDAERAEYKAKYGEDMEE